MARQASCGGKGVIKASAAAHVDDEAYESLHMNAAMLEVQNVLTEHDPQRTWAQWLFPGFKGNRLVWVCDQCRDRLAAQGAFVAAP